MSGHRRMWGFRCKACGRPTKEMFNCDLTYKDKTVALALCHKCMKRFGLTDKSEATINPFLSKTEDIAICEQKK